MSKFFTRLITEEIDSKYARMIEPFAYYSDNLKVTIEIPKGFVFDYESVPIIRGTSKRGGAVHDYLCRIDSKPIVAKKVAAKVYLEAMTCRDKIKLHKSRFNKWLRRWIKYYAVRIAPGYFHKFKVNATYEEISGRKEIHDYREIIND